MKKIHKFHCLDFYNFTWLLFIENTFFIDGTWAKMDCYDPDGTIPFNESAPYLEHNMLENDTMTPVESYWK